MLRRSILTLVVAGAVFGVMRPAEVRASDNLSSSMTAFCISGCSQVSFTLNVAGSVYVSNVMFQSLDANLWKFDYVFAVFDADWNDVTDQWSSDASVDNMRLTTANPDLTTEPLYIVLNMVRPPSGNQDQLYDNIAYYANGFQSIDGPFATGYFSTSGVVTPEPITLILLGTGLVGIAGVARLRRRKDELQGDDA